MGKQNRFVVFYHQRIVDLSNDNARLTDMTTCLHTQEQGHVHPSLQIFHFIVSVLQAEQICFETAYLKFMIIDVNFIVCGEKYAVHFEIYNYFTIKVLSSYHYICLSHSISTQLKKSVFVPMNVHTRRRSFCTLVHKT